MATARPFAYNTGTTIDGTEQIGDLSIGTPTSGFTNNPQFWNGPDEELGYVIAYPVPSEDHPTPISGVTAYLGFLGTKNMVDPLSEATFVELTNNSFSQSFTNGNEASTWLTENGYWNSWISITPTPTPSITPTPTPTPTSGVSGDFNVTISQVGPDVVWSGSGSFNTTSLISIGTSEITAGSNNAIALWIIGSGTPPGANHDMYSGVTTFPTSMGTSSFAGPRVGSGSSYGILSNSINRNLFVPTGYVSGSFISGSTTYQTSTIASLGLTPGVYTWSWGSGGNASTMVMTIENAGVTPTPTSTVTPTVTPTGTQAVTPTPTITPTSSQTPTPTPTSGATPSGFTVTISEVGSDVVMSASGTLNINDLTPLSSGGTFGQSGLIVPAAPVFIMSSIAPLFSDFDNYSGISTGPANLGTSGLTLATSFSGDMFGIVTSDGETFDLFVPPGYTTGTPISSTLTFNSTSFEGLGLTHGTYTYSWGSGANAQSVNVVIS